MAEPTGPVPDLGLGMAPLPSPHRPPPADSTTPADSNPPPDVDTCRICRGEGTPAEPLFYPCKCSGSIKYVHQDCLMEWLSHSQKKHCELCKTPFRFTKLYAPNMPKALPFHVFISHVAQYLVRNLLVWLRAALVISVWLGWLPYLMRSVWSFLFWISDEGLGHSASLHGAHDGGTSNGSSLTSALASRHDSGMCPSSPLFPITTCWAFTSIADRISLDTMPRLARALYAINITKSDRPYAAFLRLVFGDIGTKDGTALLRGAPGTVQTAQSPPSLLSDVTLLRNLTRHPSLNRVIIATFEGQIITILVVVSFILIILVRDYVVQQQPDINMRAAFAAGEMNEEEVRAQPQPNAHHNDADDRLEGQDLEIAGEIPTARTGGPPGDPDGRLFAAEIRRQYDPHDSSSGEATEGLQDEDMDLASREAGPSRDRTVSSEDEETDVRQFMRIYREAGGDPERILVLAKEQSLEDKLDWWMKLTRNKIDRQHDSDGPLWDDNGETSGHLASGTVQSNEQVQVVETRRGSVEHEHGPGQEKSSTGDDDEPLVLPSIATRPRANTDGPKVNTTINPMGNHSWSFADLPADDSRAAPEGEFPHPRGRLNSVHSRRSSSGIQVEVGSESYMLDGESSPTQPGTPGSDVDESGPLFEDDDAPVDGIPETTQPDNPDFNFNTPPPVPDVLPDVRAQAPRQPAGLVGRVAEFMWGEVEGIDPAELAPLHVPDELHEMEDVPFLDVAQEVINDERDREVVEAAVAAGLDPDAIEDAEDLEGILELLGMRGPIVGLFQNAIFCAFLVAVTLLLGLFLPYNIGRIAVWTIAHPMRLVRMLFSISKFLQDMVLICCGLVVGVSSYAFVGWWKLLSQDSLPLLIDNAVNMSWYMSGNATTRVVESLKTEMPILSANEMRNFSALSHEALLNVKAYITVAFWAVGHGLELLFGGDYPVKASEGLSWIQGMGTVAWATLKELPQTLSDPSSWVINLSLPESAGSVNPELAYWDGTDRFWAILCGYIAFSVFAALYLRRGVPFSSGPTGQDIETSLLDLLKQASGVMKVILIIGIEMLVFPLYCGLLLDVALLPLFENTTLKSRLLFTLNYPLTSIFVHWFVGTGYMFHFALFVSMCRKIMRKGVLYFIRDPDDPEFHPVRDVLERNVTTQLRKILFSAFVYGALVIICLGGVVWGLSYSIPNVLPIHYSSNEPVLEFPIDLLFYNFLMPLAVRFFKPSDGLHAMYTWWFRKCARALRLTWFLFGERKVDEEGVIHIPADSPLYEQYPWWRRIFVQMDCFDGMNCLVVPTRVNDKFPHRTWKPSAEPTQDDLITMNLLKAQLIETNQIKPDGRFVRAPASDQVKIPKGKAVFLGVTEFDQRTDGKTDLLARDIYSTNQYQLVYIPPFFRVRIFLFILFIWAFAAFTGVGITIVPLVFGRAMFKLLIPAHIRTNDIYAFSIGIYILGSVAYGISHARSLVQKAKSYVHELIAAIDLVTSHDVVRRALGLACTASRLLYAYFFLLVVFPIMVTSLMELYCLIPLNTWMYSGAFSSPSLPAVNSVSGPAVVAAASVVDINPKHTIRVIQSWTIGLLYLKLGARLVSTWYQDTRLSAAVRAVLRRGWLDPDVTVLTRAFVIPGLVLWAALVSVPLLVGRMLVAYGATEGITGLLTDGTPPHGIAINLQGYDGTGNLVTADQLDLQLTNAVTTLIYRLSFPLTALAVAGAVAGWNLIDVFRGWKIRIRDEAYLIGERLHNFGVTGQARARGPWRNGGPRL